MNRKGQMNMIGLLLAAAVLIIVGLVIFHESAAYVGAITTTVSVPNQTVTLPNAGSTLELRGQNIVGTAKICNATGGGGSGCFTANITVAEGLGSDGLTATILSAGVNLYNGALVNVSYTYEPDGYIDSAGGRSITLLILIFFGLAIAVVALVPTLRSGVVEMMGG
jgi:hypothetical protein